MTTTLRQVLKHFEEANAPISLNQMAQNLDISPGALEGMIAHWVHKGKLCEITDCADDSCASPSSCGSCPFTQPTLTTRRFELATEKNKTARAVVSTSCPHCG